MTGCAWRWPRVPGWATWPRPGGPRSSCGRTRAGRLHPWGFILERSRPGSITVNRFGRRFANESGSFDALGGPFQTRSASGDYVNDPAWVVFDSAHLAAYGAFGVNPGASVPEWFHASTDLEELAAKTGIEPAGLRSTVESWNRGVAELVDPHFQRGAEVQSAWSGDDDADSPARRTLGPIGVAPYFAVRVYMGVVGTKGGPRTDRTARSATSSEGKSAGCTPPGTSLPHRSDGVTGAQGVRSDWPSRLASLPVARLPGLTPEELRRARGQHLRHEASNLVDHLGVLGRLAPNPPCDMASQTCS